MAGKRILILGAGFGGLAAANMLRKNLASDHRVIVIDRKKSFMMGLVKLWVLEGSRGLEESQTPLDRLNAKGIEYLNDEVAKIDIASRRVQAKDHGWIGYDYLIVALGAEPAPERISGFVGRGYNLYDAYQIPALREKLLSLQPQRQGGSNSRRAVVAIAIMGMPYKCPPAPYEAAMIISDMLSKNGTRSSVEIDLYTPSPIALPVAGPKVSSAVVETISQHGIRFHPLHKLISVSDRTLEFENGSRQNYDVLIGIPPHKAPDVVRSSSLTGNGTEWISVDRYTMRTPFKDVFAIGDVTEIKIELGAGTGAGAGSGATTATTMPFPKAGIFAEEQAKVVARQIIDEIVVGGGRAIATFNGQGYCFMEVGGGRAGYIEADFYNKAGPVLKLEPPSEQNFQKKQEFERVRIKEWLLL